jgi:hypothetical protein
MLQFTEYHNIGRYLSFKLTIFHHCLVKNGKA